jgi:hypothetical protein
VKQMAAHAQAGKCDPMRFNIDNTQVRHTLECRYVD